MELIKLAPYDILSMQCNHADAQNDKYNMSDTCTSFFSLHTELNTPLIEEPLVGCNLSSSELYCMEVLYQSAERKTALDQTLFYTNTHV